MNSEGKRMQETFDGGKRMSAKLTRQLRRVEEKPAGERRLAEVKTACAYGRFGITRCYELIAAGRIDAFKDGRKTLIDLSSIDAHHRSLPRLINGARAKS